MNAQGKKTKNKNGRERESTWQNLAVQTTMLFACGIKLDRAFGCRSIAFVPKWLSPTCTGHRLRQRICKYTVKQLERERAACLRRLSSRPRSACHYTGSSGGDPGTGSQFKQDLGQVRSPALDSLPLEVAAVPSRFAHPS